MRKVTAHLYKRSDAFVERLAYVAAFLITIMLVSQLFSYDSMVDSLGVLLPAAWARSLPVILALVVVVELFALPYFLPIALSRLARICAAVCSWLVPLGWMAIMYIALGNGVQASVPLLGGHLDIALGVVPVCLVFILLVFVGAISSFDAKSRRS